MYNTYFWFYIVITFYTNNLLVIHLSKSVEIQVSKPLPKPDPECLLHLV